MTHSIEEHIITELDMLKTITDSEEGITRLAFTDMDWRGRDYIKSLMADAGLTIREDAFGNVIGRLPGRNESLPSIMSGSHTDSVPRGGNYDGVVGVLSALEVARLLQDETGKSTIQHPFEVVIFMNEEGSRFGAATLGSRAMVGALSQADLERLVDKNGVSLRGALTSRGLESSAIGESLYQNPIHSFIEVHIEQGRVLEEHKIPLGVVTGIAAPTRYKLTLSGRADHSGATPMSMRQDAMCGAAEIILKVENLAQAASGCSVNDVASADLDSNVMPPIETSASITPVVGTVGTVSVRPGAMNVIPGQVELGIDIRSISQVAKVQVCNELTSFIASVCEKRQLTYTMDTIADETPVAIDEEMINLVGTSCEDLGIEYMKLPSGAGHDAMNMAEKTQVAMIFIPCKNGVSHNPQEVASVQDISTGILVLESLVRKLDIL